MTSCRRFDNRSTLASFSATQRRNRQLSSNLHFLTCTCVRAPYVRMCATNTGSLVCRVSIGINIKTVSLTDKPISNRYSRADKCLVIDEFMSRCDIVFYPVIVRWKITGAMRKYVERTFQWPHEKNVTRFTLVRARNALRNNQFRAITKWLLEMKKCTTIRDFRFQWRARRKSWWLSKTDFKIARRNECRTTSWLFPVTTRS